MFKNGHNVSSAYGGCKKTSAVERDLSTTVLVEADRPLESGRPGSPDDHRAQRGYGNDQDERPAGPGGPGPCEPGRDRQGHDFGWMDAANSYYPPPSARSVHSQRAGQC